MLDNSYRCVYENLILLSKCLKIAKLEYQNDLESNILQPATATLNIKRKYCILVT